ncbi:hypothetical protein IBX38_06080 [Candidatus Bathyarchaeota archaeon]|nr:hypothetical protein [Candidatus Bathyarchaeota archaeon]
MEEALEKKKAHHPVVIKSTVMLGATENLVKSALEQHSNKQCGIHFGVTADWAS